MLQLCSGQQRNRGKTDENHYKSDENHRTPNQHNLGKTNEKLEDQIDEKRRKTEAKRFFKPYFLQLSCMNLILALPLLSEAFKAVTEGFCEVVSLPDNGSQTLMFVSVGKVSRIFLIQALPQHRTSKQLQALVALRRRR